MNLHVRWVTEDQVTRVVIEDDDEEIRRRHDEIPYNDLHGDVLLFL